MNMFEAAAYLITGLAAGATFFALLRWNTALYLRGGGVPLALAVQTIRIASLGGLLALTASHGALPLLLAALGLVIARPVVLRLTPMGDA